MDDIPETPSAVLLITVWFEPGAPTLRARVIRTADMRVTGESVLLVGRDAVVADVRNWLDAFQTAHDRPR
ncbi:hypothetical protein [Streptomyces sp. NBC_01356]|uniref:hypothetical protein n=1 Tax=unclassified Streptomyces TaxID=2593676 RepID=UPI002E34BB0A|nr:hypothetical protein [Streptomyces sp. NBC_01356]WTB37577.1 hypothetical protein OG569_06045 [Streptomyces sp. NBC_00827]WUC14695.1 hypothetical protein OG256_34750 [Streptomyces sp. NBC_00564]